MVRVDLTHNQTHDKLLSYLQKSAPIRQLECCIRVQREQINVQHPLFTFLQSTPTLERVTFNGYYSYFSSDNHGRSEYLLALSRNEHVTFNDYVSSHFDEFLDAVSQNDSIRTVKLWGIYCSAFAVHKLMQRKIHWEVRDCHIISRQDLSRDDYTCYVEELKLDIKDDAWSVLDLLLHF